MAEVSGRDAATTTVDGLARLLAGRRRITVLGTPGGGKSTLARALAARLDLACHHVDDHFWQAGWRPAGADELAARIAALAAGERWLIEGNHVATVADRARRADAVVILDVAWPVSLTRISRRSLAARCGRPTLLPDRVRGEREPWRARLLVCRAAVRFRRRTLPDLLDILDRQLAVGVPVLHLRRSVARQRASAVLTEAR
ncbi:adenylate kinase [Micromonospora echinofusca]|uniref:adenylate kinase n=1 Tax=Micromonospora echinofusca TaxID=47858 RepID=UPI003405A849